MIRFRFVEEYRGRRIVTNGTMFGIEGELITDCRYLDIAGARATIDSDAGIAAYRKHSEWQRQKAVEYLARVGKDRTFACECGWRGRNDELVKTARFVGCPRCASEYVVMMAGDVVEESEARNENARERARKEQAGQK